jgi:hypothetical protein
MSHDSRRVFAADCMQAEFTELSLPVVLLSLEDAASQGFRTDVTAPLLLVRRLIREDQGLVSKVVHYFARAL